MNERIRELRNRLHLSQKEFGDRLGVSRDVIANIENGRVETQEPIIKLICSEFNVNYDWLKRGDGSMYADNGDDNIEVMRLIDKVLSGENETVRRVFKSFAKLTDKEWEALGMFIDGLSD